MNGRFRRKPPTWLLALLAGAIAGCVYIPTPEHEEPFIPISHRGRVTTDTLDRFVPGESTRADVLLALGEPSSRESEDRYLTYSWTAIQGYVAILIPGAQPAPVKNVHDLVFEFDNDGRLKRFGTFDDGLFGKRSEAIEKWKAGEDTGTSSR